jgi:hypothetical protein
MSESTLLKPLVMAGTVVAIDKFVMNNPNMTESLYFGVAGAVGVYTGGMVAKALPLPLPSGDYFSGKTLETRLAEISIGAGGAYALNRFVLKNDFNSRNMVNKIGILVASDFVSEYITDYLNGKPLSFFV